MNNEAVNACIAYRLSTSGVGICANGFIQTIYCAGEVKCHACGRHSEGIPNCMREDLPEHWLNEDMSPRFYRGPGQ